MTPKRPDFIRHHSELPVEEGHYPGQSEMLSLGTALSRPLGLSRLGIHHEVLPPGHRTSYPHAEEREEEFVFVLEGTPDVWIDGELHPLKAGDCVAFPPGTGICHNFINNSDRDTRLLVIGERIPESRVHYPLNPERMAELAPEKRWDDVPKRPLGPHPGKASGTRLTQS